MSVKARFKTTGRLFVRGEQGVAGMGIAMAMVLILCFVANAYLSDRAGQETAARQKQAQLNAAGPLMAETAGRLIAANDWAALQRLTASTAASLELETCAVTLGGRVVADRTGSRLDPPFGTDRSATDAADSSTDISAATDVDGRLRFPIAVAGSAAGFVELTAASAPPQGTGRFAASALVCAAALAVLVLVYRRTRHKLAELELIRSALSATNEGETAVAALQIDARLGPTAVAWNKLLDEVDVLRQKARGNAGLAVAGNRRSGGNNLESACDAMSQGIVLVDDQMRVRFANGAACTFLKLDRASLSGSAAIDMVQDDKFQEAMRNIAAGKLRRPVTLELEHASDTGNGVLRVGIRPVRRGDADSAMIIIEDVTQQRTAEQARNQFINQVTHELRTPLTNIRLYAETAIEDGETNPEVRANCLNVINQESRRLERIVSEMLSVAEIEAGCTTVRRDEVYIDVLMNEMARDYRAQADEKRVALQFVLSPKLPKLSADKDKLTLALHNLIGNALKYTPEGGKVTVSVDVRDGHLAVDVADTGIGIEPGEAEKIFDRFFRSADPRVGKIVGTGLGLTLAREVMRLHGGDVTVESQIDRGSTFTATVPLAAAA